MRPVRILVVGDFEPWRQQVFSMLKTQPELKVVGEVSDGLEALRIAEELKPSLILLDIGLPHVNGIDTARRLCQTVPGATILVLSENHDAELVRAALSNGAQGYVFKTDAESDLLPAIKAILRGEMFVSGRTKGDDPSAPADNDGMKRTAVDQVLGQLAGEGKTYNVKVDLTVKEIWVAESMTPLDRAVIHATLSSTSGVVLEDGDYTLRYCFNGILEEHAVRVEDGTLLSDMTA